MTAAPASAQGAVLRGEGTGMITSLEETSSRTAGGNRIAERTIEGVMLSGPLQGTFTEEVRGVIHRDGRVTFQGTMNFQGTLEGCGDGTLTGRLTGRGQAGAAPLTEATISVIQQAAATIAASGHGTVHQDGPVLTYEIDYVCR